MGHDGRNLPDTSAGPGDVRGYGLPLVRNTPGYADIPFIGKRTHRSRCLLAVCHRLDRRAPLLLARGSRNQGQDLGRNRKMVADSKKAKGLRPRKQKLFQSSSTTPRFDTTEVDCHKSSTASAVLGVQRSRKEISAGEPAGGSKNSVPGFVGDDISDGRAIDDPAIRWSVERPRCSARPFKVMRMWPTRPAVQHRRSAGLPRFSVSHKRIGRAIFSQFTAPN